MYKLHVFVDVFYGCLASYGTSEERKLRGTGYPTFTEKRHLNEGDVYILRKC